MNYKSGQYWWWRQPVSGKLEIIYLQVLPKGRGMRAFPCGDEQGWDVEPKELLELIPQKEEPTDENHETIASDGQAEHA